MRWLLVFACFLVFACYMIVNLVTVVRQRDDCMKIYEKAWCER